MHSPAGLNTVEPHLSGLIGITIHPEMQKIRIIGYFFLNRLLRQFEVGEKNSTNGCFGLHIHLRTNEALIHNSLHAFDN